MTDPVREYEGTWEEIRARDAELAGHRVRLTILTGSEPETPAIPDSRALTAREVRRLPFSQRARYLQNAAANAAPHYETDLARPPHLRELTAMTALDGEDFDDDAA